MPERISGQRRFSSLWVGAPIPSTGELGLEAVKFDRPLNSRANRFAGRANAARCWCVIAHPATPSMSRTGNFYDNAPMERFFHIPKVELVHQRRWATPAGARQALFGYIEGNDNRHRMHSALGYLTPEQTEQTEQAEQSMTS